MNQFGDLYSQYYDLFYKDKDYQGEADYVENLIKNNIRSASTILDLGCGTGRHAELFCDKGYAVHGVDLSSDMLAIADKRREGREDFLSFSQADISSFSLGKKFDVVMALFHVMSYQNKDKDLQKVFSVAKSHLNRGGLFIFDFWYGPAVLTDLPAIRVKRLESDKIKVTRISEPLLWPCRNIVEVMYELFIENKQTREFHKQNESHSMRYFFDPELEKLSEEAGFKVQAKHRWLCQKSPDLGSWYVVWILGLS